MVVTDLFFPDINGGARRTLETARILTELGYHVTIVCNRRSEDPRHEIIENFDVFRIHLIDIGAKARNFLRKVMNFTRRIFRKKISEDPVPKVFESHLDRKPTVTFREKLKDFYRHKFPLHKILKWLPAFVPIVRLIKKNQIDVVYERGPSYGVGILAAKTLKRTSIVDFIDIMYWNWALKHCSRILSYFTTDQIPNFVNRSKIDTVYTCADIIRFDPNSKEIQLIEKQSKNLGMYIGGFYHWHGLDYLVEAMVYLNNNHRKWIEKTGLQIQLIGQGEYSEYIRNLIKERNVGDLFLLHDRIDFDQVPSYLKIADFCISLNTGDALGMKVFEYMAMSKSVLISNIDIVPKFLSEDIVYMVNPQNPQEIAQRIKEIIDHPEERNQKGQKARELVVKKYNWNKHGRNIHNSIIKSIKAQQKG